MKSFTKKFWNTLPDGRGVDLYTLTADDGAFVSIATLGGGLINLVVPDKEGHLGDCILGFDDPAAYTIPENGYLGLLVGPYANRIAKGQFYLNDKLYQLPINDNGVNCLHGNGRFSMNLWEVKDVSDTQLTLTFFTPDMEDGFPGNLTCTVTYTFTDDHVLSIEYAATTDQDTFVNFTNHAYFNLACDDSLIHDHILQIDADSYTELNEANAPTGAIKSVKENPEFDFTAPKAIGQDIDANQPDLNKARGYDHNFCLNHEQDRLSKAAVCTDPKSGRTLEVWTTEPGMQVYTANFMPGIPGKYGYPVAVRRGVCFETQHYADSPNQPDFPSTLLKAGETYLSKTEFRFI